MIKKICFIITVLVFQTQVYSLIASQYDAYIKIKPDKKEYIVGEPVWVEVELENFGDRSIIMSGSWLREAVKVLPLSDGDQRPIDHRLSSSQTNVPEMKKGDKISSKVELVDDFGTYLHTNISLGLKFLPAGEYVIYANPYGIKSDSVHIKIVEPKSEEKQALKLLQKISKDLSEVPHEQDKALQEFQKVEKDVMKLLTKYPNSVYGPKILDIMTIKLTNNEDIKSRYMLFSLTEEFYIRFPQHKYYIPKIIDREISKYGIGDKKSKRDALQRIIDKNFNTTVTDEAKRQLEILEKGPYIGSRNIVIQKE